MADDKTLPEATPNIVAAHQLIRFTLDGVANDYVALEDGSYVVDHCGTPAVIEVLRSGPGRAVVHIQAMVLAQVPLTPELFEWVATEGQSFLLYNATVQVLEDGLGLLSIDHTTFGEDLTPGDLVDYIRTLLLAAHDWTQQLQPRFGGVPFEDGDFDSVH